MSFEDWVTTVERLLDTEYTALKPQRFVPGLWRKFFERALTPREAITGQVVTLTGWLER